LHTPQSIQNLAANKDLGALLYCPALQPVNQDQQIYRTQFTGNKA
jgi:hypothetical protein